MPTVDQARIDADRASPRIMQLWWALQPLKSVIRFMQTGAHPDDEISGMLAALAFRDGFNISYACSTRGEGGQNDIGQEAGAALGALRTREMERACDILGMRMYWHGQTPDDPITDFGFSKSGDETLGRWGHDRTLARFVDIVRREKPDIICPTFLNVPGQHGHHRAMTQAAHEVMAAAADPSAQSNLAPWQVKKLYLPAWSGAGQAYDDDLPPPPATLTVDGAGGDPVSGWSWGRIGQQSRAFHRTQGMGSWVPVDQTRDWPLHLVQSHTEGPDEVLGSGLPVTVGDLAGLNGEGGGTFAKALNRAQAAIEASLTAFPAFGEVARLAFQALEAVREAHDACPDALREAVTHRLDAKEVQLGHVIRLALGVDIRGRTSDVFLTPGTRTSVALECGTGDADLVEVAYDLPPGWVIEDQRLTVGAAAAPTPSYPESYDPQSAHAPAIIATVSKGGATAAIRLPFEQAPVVLPAQQADVTPDAALINLSGNSRAFDGRIEGLQTEGAPASLRLPEGWVQEGSHDAFTMHAPDDLTAGLYRLPVQIGADPAMKVQRIQHAHTAPTAFAEPAVLRVLAVRAAVPAVRVGYVGAGNDNVNHWLARLGADVRDITDSELMSDADLAQYDSIVIGIFAMRFRNGLSEARPRLHRWVKAGGTLVTLYHRPWDNWQADTTPPHRLEIGQPSLRWRVTDENCTVRHLTEHPILSSPNPIGPDDWVGWVKERGLYFAKSWDAAYTPLIEMADPGEDPHQGALLVADVGQGRHVHTALILHHQMKNLVPGAFRLMANLIAKRT